MSQPSSEPWGFLDTQQNRQSDQALSVNTFLPAPGGTCPAAAGVSALGVPICEAADTFLAALGGFVKQPPIRAPLLAAGPLRGIPDFGLRGHEYPTPDATEW